MCLRKRQPEWLKGGEDEYQAAEEAEPRCGKKAAVSVLPFAAAIESLADPKHVTAMLHGQTQADELEEQIVAKAKDHLKQFLSGDQQR